MPEKVDDAVSSRLDVIIRLLLERERKDNEEITIGDQIVMLESTGLKGRDVARIFGIDVGQLPSYRRGAKKAKRKNIGRKVRSRRIEKASENADDVALDK